MGKVGSKGRKWMEVPFPATENSSCTIIGLGKMAKEIKGQFHNLPFLPEWIITLLHIPKMLTKLRSYHYKWLMVIYTYVKLPNGYQLFKVDYEIQQLIFH